MSNPIDNRSEYKLAALGQDTLKPIVRMLYSVDHVDVTHWRHHPVEGGFGHAYGVYRFQGQALMDGVIRDWSAILKIMGPVGGSHKPTDWNFWKREVLVYQSGLLDDLAEELVAPRCLGVVEQPDGEIWLWIEDVHESESSDWPLERYGLAARHLGRFNGAYLTGKPMPTLSWLSIGKFRRRLADAESSVAELPELRKNPIFAGMSTDESIAHGLRLWAHRGRLLTELDRLPLTLCHHDSFRRNLFARDGANDRSQTVIIDWAKLGPGVVGEELVALFSTTLRFVAVEIDRIAELDSLIFDGYVAGLRDAGWQGDVRLARFGFAATAFLDGIADRAIKWPNVAKRVAALPPDAEPLRLLNPGGVPQSAAKHMHLLTLGDEAMALLDALH